MTTAAQLGLNNTQFNWAQKIVTRVKSKGLPVRAAHIALGTALTESSLYMFANSNNPASMRIAHDMVGSDHGSVGLFQQQVGGAPNSTANWGTTAQCMDVNYSTDAFLRGLQRFDWMHMTNWDAAQKVQGSFDPTGGNYKRNDALAIRIGNALWGGVTSAPPPPKSGIVGHYTVQSGDNLTSIAKKYPQAWVTAQSIQRLNNITDPNKIYPGQVLVIG